MNDSDVGGEQRRSPRSEVRGSAMIQEDGAWRRDLKVLNLSAGGALLVGPPTKPNATRVDLRLHVLGLAPFTTAATVIRRELRSVGHEALAVEFSGLDEATRVLIDRYVRARLRMRSSRGAGCALIVGGASLLQLPLAAGLRSLGFDCRFAGTELNAVRQLESSIRAVDVVLIDGSANTTLAEDVLDLLGAEYPWTRIVAAVTPNTAGMAMARGEVLRWPWTRDDLAAAVGSAAP